MNNKTIGDKIRAARLANGLTLRGLEKLSGVANGDISNHETGRRYPTLKSLERYAAAMGYELRIEFMKVNGE